MIAPFYPWFLTNALREKSLPDANIEEDVPKCTGGREFPTFLSTFRPQNLDLPELPLQGHSAASSARPWKHNPGSLFHACLPQRPNASPLVARSAQSHVEQPRLLPVTYAVCNDRVPEATIGRTAYPSYTFRSIPSDILTKRMPRRSRRFMMPTAWRQMSDAARNCSTKKKLETVCREAT